MTLETLTALFGWMTAINVALFTLSLVLSMIVKDWATALHARLFGIDATRARDIWYAFLGAYKIAIIMLNLVPYLALRIVT